MPKPEEADFKHTVREGQNGELDNVKMGKCLKHPSIKKGQEEQKVERVLRFVLFLLISLSPCSRKLKKRELFYSKIQTLTIKIHAEHGSSGGIQTREREICRVHPHLDQMKTMRVSMLTVKVDITPLESETSFPVAVTLLRESLVGDNSPQFGLPMILALLYVSLSLYLVLLSLYYANKILIAEFEFVNLFKAFTHY